MKKTIIFVLCSMMLLPALFAANEMLPYDTKRASDTLETQAAQPLSKEEQEIEDITKDTAASPGVKPAQGQQQGLTDEQKEDVRKAEKFFREAVISYRLGNADKAKKFYGAFTAMMNAASLPADFHYMLTDDYESMFLKMNKLVDDTSAVKNTIPMTEDNELVKKYLRIYTAGDARERISKALERSGRYREMILSILKEYGLPEELCYLPVVESLYNNNDLSHAGALGIWQFMPKRARALNLKINYWIDERKDPEKATRAAAEYLRDLFLMFDDWHLALAAYNRGEYGLGRDLRFSQAVNISQMSDRKAVPKETQNYVPQFIAAALIAENYKKYGLNPQFEQPIEYDEVVTTNVVDLKVVAECAGTDVGKIKELNPAIMAWCTPQNYPEFKLKLPKGSKDAYLANISKVKELNPTRGFIKYKVVKGDYISKIANKFNASVSSVKEDNKLKESSILRIGQVLIVRPGKKYFAKK